MFAKGQTVKITIKGADLKTPITDPQVLTELQVWSGPGTSSSAPGFDPNAPGFIVDWSQAAVEPTEGLVNEIIELTFVHKAPPLALISASLTFLLHRRCDVSCGGMEASSLNCAPKRAMKFQNDWRL
jgi:hypothetical protein